jgi:hypothetical protein
MSNQTANPKNRAVVRQNLKHRQSDTDLAGIRDKEFIKKLPESERDSWRKLWDDVESLRSKEKDGE